MTAQSMKIGEVAELRYHGRSKPVPDGYVKVDDMTGHPLHCYCVLIRKIEAEKCRR